MDVVARVTSKGQVTVPKAVRDALGTSYPWTAVAASKGVVSTRFLARSCRLLGDEPVVVAEHVGSGGGEARRAESTGEILGSNRVEGIPGVAGSDQVQVERLLADEDAAGAQDSVNFGEEAILVVGRAHVVQDREAGDGCVTLGRQAGPGRVCNDNFDIRPREALAEDMAQFRIHFDSGEPGDPLAEQVGGQAWTRADLQHVASQVAGRLDPGQQLGLERLRPFRTGQVLQVGFVHPPVVRCLTDGCLGWRGQQSDQTGQDRPRGCSRLLPCAIWYLPLRDRR